MKEKIVIFIIGLLLGAIISTGSIYLYTVANSSNNNDQNTMMNAGIGQSVKTQNAILRCVFSITK